MNLMNLLLFGSCLGTGTTATNASGAATSSGSQWYIIVIYVVIFAAIIYFLMIRPQRKQRQQQEKTMSSIEPGDSVLTTSGFYGTIVAVNGDTIIVEFGNNKNCRIPMSKQAISQIEKANAGQAQAAAPAEGTNKRKFFGRNKAAEEAAQAEKEAAAAAEEAAPAVEEAAEAVEKTEE